MTPSSSPPARLPLGIAEHDVYRSLFNAYPDALIVADAQGQIVMANPMAASLLEAFGRIDVLVNNAAIFAALNKGPFDQIALAEWEQVMKVNVTGAYLAVCAVAPAMRQARWGRIINISSDAVPRGIANYLHYVTSKSALIGMTNALARELGPYGVTVNCVRPGATATEVERIHNPTAAGRDKILSEQCLQRGQMPEDLTGIVMFFATEAASFITGQTIAADGGLTHNS